VHRGGKTYQIYEHFVHTAKQVRHTTRHDQRHDTRHDVPTHVIPGF
jgi:hypothetical protein